MDDDSAGNSSSDRSRCQYVLQIAHRLSICEGLSSITLWLENRAQVVRTEYDPAVVE